MIQNFRVEREKMRDPLHHEEKKFFVYYILKIYNIALALLYVQLHLEPNF